MKNNSSTAKQDVGMNDETVIISIIVNNKKKKTHPSPKKQNPLGTRHNKTTRLWPRINQHGVTADTSFAHLFCA